MRAVLIGVVSLILLCGCEPGNAANSRDPVLRSIVSCMTHDTCKTAKVRSDTLPNGNRIRSVAIIEEGNDQKIIFTYGDLGEFGVSFGEGDDRMLMDENGDGSVDSVFMPSKTPGDKTKRVGLFFKFGSEYTAAQTAYRSWLDAAHRTLVAKPGK